MSKATKWLSTGILIAVVATIFVLSSTDHDREEYLARCIDRAVRYIVLDYQEFRLAVGKPATPEQVAGRLSGINFADLERDCIKEYESDQVLEKRMVEHDAALRRQEQRRGRPYTIGGEPVR